MTAVRPPWRQVPVRSDPEARAEDRAEPLNRRIRLVVVIAVLLGIVLRLWLVLSPLGDFDSDEAVAGLMGRHILDGDFRVFYWGQAYGGAHEAFLLAALFALGFSSRVAMELVPIGLSAAAAVLVWRIGLRTIGRNGALLAAAVCWAATSVFVWQSTKERSFYATTLVAGLAVTLLTLRLLERPSRRDALLLGVAAGVGWHSSPNIVYLVVPAVGWLVVESIRTRRLEALRLWWLTVAGVVAGALPWIVFNISTGGDSVALAQYGTDTTYLNRFGLFFKQGLAYALGAQTPHYPIRWPSVLLYLIALAGLVVALVRLPRKAWGIGAGVVVFPFVFAIFPTSWYVGEPRYLSFLWPLLALVIGAGIARIRRHGRALVLLGAIAVYTIGGTALMVERGSSSPIADLSPGDLSGTIRHLQSQGSDRVFADYWIGYRLALETDEEIVASPLASSRYEPYDVDVRATARPAYVFFHTSCIEGELLRLLDERGVPYTRTVNGRFAVVQPAERVLPEEGFQERVEAAGIGQGQMCPAEGSLEGRR